MKQLSFFSVTAIALLAASCSDSQFDGYKRAESGLNYKFYTETEGGKKVEKGDGIVVRYIISKESNDSVIVDSKNVSNDGSGYAQFQMSESSFKGSFEDGLFMMAAGDSASFIISADSFYLKTNQAMSLPAGFKPGEFVKGVFKVKEIRNKEQMEAMRKKQMEERAALMKEMEAKEKPQIEKYLADNKINVKATASGLFYSETKKGTGASPKETDVVIMHYTGRLLDGTVFDSSVEKGQPLEYPLNQMISGWVEGVQMMKKGGKAILVVPSALAYGPQGQGSIPPFSPLAFEVELLDFHAPAPAAQMQQAPGK
jgi:FKBP-type peptidyl-prolyl cis-trans isomerase